MHTGGMNLTKTSKGHAEKSTSHTPETLTVVMALHPRKFGLLEKDSQF